MEDIEAKYIHHPSAARVLGIATQTLAKWRVAKRGPPYYKVGRKVMYAVDDVTSWMESQRFSSTKEYTAARGRD